MSLILCPDLYTKPPKSAIPGARIDRRTITLTTAQVANDNIVALGVLPAASRLQGFYLESADLDSGANTIAINLGVLNTYYNQAAATVAVPADYDSGGQTNTGTAPALVSGQNILSLSDVAQAGGRIEYSALDFSDDIGVDNDKDRIIAAEFKTVGTGAGGKLTLGLLYDQE